MKSIRLSLIVYFLLLLGLALGAVSVLVYRTTYVTLLAKKETTRKLLQAQYEDRCQEVRTKLDDELFYQARILADKAQSQSPWFRPRFPTFLGLLGATPTGGGHGMIQQGVAQWGLRPDLSFGLNRLLGLTEIQFNEDLIPRHATGSTEYFQINS